MISISKKSIETAFLLSSEEWETTVSNVPNVPVEIGCFWWLSTSGSKAYSAAAGITPDGRLSQYPIWYANGSVRPAFKVTQNALNGATPGTKVQVAHLTCTVIDKDIVLSDECVCCRCFSREKITTNYYESEIYNFLNSKEFFKLI